VALHAEEILRCKWELGVSVTLIGAEPYITYLAVFDKAIAPYIIDPTTTSATPVVASSPAAQTSIVVAAIPVIAGTSTPAFGVGSTVTVDVGPPAEQAVILVLSGTTLWLTLANAHGSNGAYPVTMAGGEQVVRDVLARLDAIKSELLNVAPKTAGIEQVDEVKIFPATTVGSRRGTRDKFESLIQQREQARDDLGEAIGFPNLRRMRRGGGARAEAY
jgi:hypothetical protein